MQKYNFFPFRMHPFHFCHDLLTFDHRGCGDPLSGFAPHHITFIASMLRLPLQDEISEIFKQQLFEKYGAIAHILYQIYLDCMLLSFLIFSFPLVVIPSHFIEFPSWFTFSHPPPSTNSVEVKVVKRWGSFTVKENDELKLCYLLGKDKEEVWKRRVLETSRKKEAASNILSLLYNLGWRADYCSY